MTCTTQTQYAAEIASAGRDIARAGASVTFTRIGGSYDPLTDTSVPCTQTATGSAVRVKPFRSDYMRLQAGDLVLIDPVTLLVAAAGMGFNPQPGDTFVWGGVGYTVRSIDATAPDGVYIVSKVVGSR